MSHHRRNRVLARTVEKLATAPIRVPVPTNRVMNNAFVAAPRAPRQQASEEEIRLCAYRKWESAGRPPGDGVQFWLEAEAELKQAT
jgi:hypothetical protein